MSATSETAAPAFARSSYLAAGVFGLGFAAIAAGYVASYVQVKTFQAQAIAAEARYNALKEQMAGAQTAPENAAAVPVPIAPAPVVPAPSPPAVAAPNDVLTETGRLLNAYGRGTLDKSVNWAELQRAVEAMPSGDRRRAVLSAIQLAWRSAGVAQNPELPAPGYGIGGIVAEELTIAGRWNPQDGVPDRDALVKLLTATSDPKAGDIAILPDTAGGGILVLLAVDEARGLTGVLAIPAGTRAMILHEGSPLRILSIGSDQAKALNPTYLRVPYPD